MERNLIYEASSPGVETLPNGYAVDFKGEKITWPNGGRIPEVVFGFGEFLEEIKRSF